MGSKPPFQCLLPCPWEWELLLKGISYIQVTRNEAYILFYILLRSVGINHQQENPWGNSFMLAQDILLWSPEVSSLTWRGLCTVCFSWKYFAAWFWLILFFNMMLSLGFKVRNNCLLICRNGNNSKSVIIHFLYILSTAKVFN